MLKNNCCDVDRHKKHMQKMFKYTDVGQAVDRHAAGQNYIETMYKTQAIYEEEARMRAARDTMVVCTRCGEQMSQEEHVNKLGEY